MEQKLILFDIDKTLIKEMERSSNPWPLAFQSVYGIKCEITLSQANSHGMTHKQIVIETLKNHGLKENEILEKKGIVVIPDILANAGGVTVSYFEWVQNREGYYWTEKKILSRLEPIMLKAYHDSLAKAKTHQTSLRTGTYLLAINRVVQAIKLKGY